MIAKGNTHGDGVKLASYLVTGEQGERAELLDMRGFTGSDIHAAFRDIERAKLATKADAAFFHVQIRGADGEGSKLSRAQWLEIANGCDAALGRGMARQGRAASLHIDEATGDMHMHLAYDLIRQRADGRLYVAKLGLFETRLQLYAREIEKKYGLRIVSNERRPGAHRADRREQEESRRLGTDSHAIRTAILDALEKSDSGKAFVAAMKAQGMELAAGDRRDCFVVIDEAGGHHALNKKLTGKTLAEIRERLSDLDRAQLPSVETAQEWQRARQPAREAARAAREAVQAWKTAEALTLPGQATTRTTEAHSGLSYREKQRVIHDRVVSRAEDMRAARSARYSNANRAERAAENTAGKAAGILGRGILSMFAGLLKLFDLFPAKPPSAAQQKRNYWAAMEQEATDAIAAKKETHAEQERQQRRNAQQDVGLAAILATSRTIGTGTARRDHEIERDMR